MVRTCERPWRRAAYGEPCHQWTYLQEDVSDLSQGRDVRQGKVRAQGRDVQGKGGDDSQADATATPRRCTDGASDAVDMDDRGGTYGRSA